VTKKVPWPEELLSQDIPDARIITYGYDADVVHWTRPAGQNTVREHARNLVNDLAAIRQKTPKSVGRPIIFVAHSLGGLICEDAIFTCNNPTSSAQRDILDSVRGLIFLGTPHAGSDFTMFATAVADIIRLSLVKTPNKSILQVLKRNSEVLANIENDFLTLVRTRAEGGRGHIKLHSFVEELPVTATGHVGVSETLTSSIV
jgi:protein SERAC1